MAILVTVCTPLAPERAQSRAAAQAPLHDPIRYAIRQQDPSINAFCPPPGFPRAIALDGQRAIICSMNDQARCNQAPKLDRVNIHSKDETRAWNALTQAILDLLRYSKCAMQGWTACGLLFHRIPRNVEGSCIHPVLIKKTHKPCLDLMHPL